MGRAGAESGGGGRSFGGHSSGRMNKVAGGIDTSGSIAAFERMEEKADKLLDAANAEAELNEGIHSTADLADKYASGSSASVDDELAQMKAELGL